MLVHVSEEERAKDYEQKNKRHHRRCKDGVAFLLYIWKVPGSNLGPQTGYPDYISAWFLSEACKSLGSWKPY